MMSRMKVLDKKHGDKRVEWNPKSDAEIEDARSSFEFFTKEEGYKAYRVDPKAVNKKGEEMKVFDPTATEIILVPATALVGG